MASFANQFSFFLLLTLLSSLHIHARDSQFFNKIPSTTNNAVVPNTKETTNPIPTNQPQQEQQQDPNFLPENENAYGLYGHESGQLPPSATTSATVDPTATTAAPLNTQSSNQLPTHKYLPKNYNPVAYVTKPEETNEFNEESSVTDNNYYEGQHYNNNNNNYNEGQNYNNNNNNYNEGQPSNNNYNEGQNYNNNNNNNQQQNEEETETEYYAKNREINPNKVNYYYNNGGRSSYSRGGAAARYGGESNGFQPQGMSDTRFVENGKYFYDVNTEKYSTNHPYESLKSASPARNGYSGNRNYYGNGENVNGYELNRGFQQQNGEEEFLDEENYNMP